MMIQESVPCKCNAVLIPPNEAFSIKNQIDAGLDAEAVVLPRRTVGLNPTTRVPMLQQRICHRNMRSGAAARGFSVSQGDRDNPG